MDQRRQRGERTKQALIGAALRLFGSRGYESTTVDDIAAAAGVSSRTFFHHFATKEDVLFDGYPGRLAEATRRFRSAHARSLWASLSAASMAVVDAIEEQPELFLQRGRLYAEVPALRAVMLRINEEWIDGLSREVASRLGADPRLDVSPRLAAALASSANRVAIETWTASGGTADLRAHARRSLELVRPAVARIERSSGDRRTVSDGG